LTTRLTRAEKRAETRQALIDAAARVFAARGFAGASVEEIAAEAGFTRGAFYSNFRTKEELFAELLQQRAFSVYRDMATESAEGHPSLRETGERLAAIQRDENGQSLFRLWLELLAHAGRDEDLEPKLALLFGTGMGMTMDEAALLLDLDDVYWTERGLVSVQISLALTALLGALAIGLRFLQRGEATVLPDPQLSLAV